MVVRRNCLRTPLVRPPLPVMVELRSAFPSGPPAPACRPVVRDNLPSLLTFVTISLAPWYQPRLPSSLQPCGILLLALPQLALPLFSDRLLPSCALLSSHHSCSLVVFPRPPQPCGLPLWSHSWSCHLPVLAGVFSGVSLIPLHTSCVFKTSVLFLTSVVSLSRFVRAGFVNALQVVFGFFVFMSVR